MMENTYYNLIPPLAQSEDLDSSSVQAPPSSPGGGSDDSGVPTEAEDQHNRPQRPPRACDEPELPAAKMAEHSYINLPAEEVPPILPKRQPYMVNPRSPALPHHVVTRSNSCVGPSTSSSSSSSVITQLFHSRHQNQNQNRNCSNHHFQQQTQQRFQRQRRRGACKCKAPGGECSSNANVGGGEEDVVLLYSRHCSGAVEWAKYLHKLYTELSKHKGKLRVRHLPVEDMAECMLPPHIEEEICQSRLQLVLLSPTLLQFLYRHPSLMMGRLLHPDRVIAIMLGVRDGQITHQHRSSLVSFSQWIHLEAKDHDLEFVQTVLYFSTQILQRTSSNKRSLSSYTNNRILTRPESNLFHIHPRKVSESQNKILVIFESPQSARSKMKLTLERHQCGLQDIDLDETKLLNPFNLLVTIPNCCFSVCNMAALRLEVDGANRGSRSIRLESTLSEIDQLLKTSHDPIEFMCQAFGVTPSCKDQLDEALSKHFLLARPKSGFQLLKGLSLAVEKVDLIPKDIGEFPTLLHFSACHGLDRLTSVLVDCPGARDAIQMRNISDMTPAELAQVNGHFDLANNLHAFHIASYKGTTHVYDYIQQQRDTKGADYQIPPPPRPVLLNKEVFEPPIQPYMDMSGSGSSDDTTPKTSRKMSDPFIIDKFGTMKATKSITKGVECTSKDPYGTLRASKRLVQTTKADSHHHQVSSYVHKSEEDDDVFAAASNNDPFGTLKANKPLNKPRPTEQVDYRGVPPEFNQANGQGRINEDLAITDELLQLLEDFQSKSYSVKEMEMLFESWRRKAAIVDGKTDFHDQHSGKEDMEDLKDKVRRNKATHLLMKFFKHTATPNSTKDLSQDSQIKHTKNTRTFRKPCPDSVSTKPNCIGPMPMPGNDTILEGEITIINESDMSVVALPPTPQKSTNSFASSREGISTQILPLSRLSLSSNSSPPSSNNEDSPSNRPVAQVQPFSPEDMPNAPNNSRESGEEPLTPNNSSIILPTRNKVSPVREKLDKLRRSLTEPLFQYFHDLQVSPDNEEPEVLNTPKSVAPPTTASLKNGSTTQQGIKSRNLFGGKDPYENVPPPHPAPPIVTDM